ncbi:PGF-CTERM sorting domain-containing protein [Haloprofundus marisrubri]|uniref:PGF-CTERM sorting domain-containing protein n=1 Tax=Haloprofundus marisrubri TaxID=1514971 RepID=A0A0W1R789_9EURY|nr:PGF-CTERM sorting domain-containing protein [Haloprofundus marisrubri]KTG09278.1 PGF-CTERM sorting domain-containing protein [Haloprofundus marisrubri]
MNRETTFVAAATVVVVASLVAAAVVPGALADPTDDGPLRPGPVHVEEVPIAPGAATGETATLAVEARLEHRGNPTDNVTVLFRAIDSESNLVETSRTVEVGTLTGDRETPVRANLTVAREGGYEIETIVFRDGERVADATRRVSGLEALTPAYADSNVVFAESTALQPVSVSVGSAEGDRVSLDLSGALTNEGDTPTGDLEVTFVVRQAESNVVADRVTVPVGEIRAGRTSTVDASVTVPAEYNYYVDAILWRDDVHVDSAQSVANLDPTERISANVTEQEVEFEVEDFESDDEETTAAEDGGTYGADSQTTTPGFGVAVAVVALLATALLVRRRSE